MSSLHMPTAQAMSLYEEIFAREAMHDQTRDDLAFESLKVCELETVVEDLTLRAEKADALECKVAELNAVIETMLRAQHSRASARSARNAQLIQEVADGYDSPSDGYYAALPDTGLVIHPNRWYSSA